ncbi:hypothetical protein [Thalassobacillus sp. CUG 92003]|uniref:hypothetical protein n=1 Tax=Thalassobacillus sp. CUG 92003 TaxID=2736641 RepID=UPI0015E7DBA0|nr:hypothetical protein [Thalassobacillus sp. CUG 92003]
MALSFSAFLGAGSILTLGNISLNTYRRYVRTSVFERVGNDGKTLNDRIWQFAGDLRSSIANTVRRGALQGRQVTDIQREVKKTYDNERWKIDRLIETETMTGYREATALGAENSDVVKGVRIVDHPDGHSHHQTHECYKYARADEHGMGKGVYPPGTQKILQPHPNCRATLHYVLTEEATENA